MTAEMNNTAGAASRATVDWHAIDWQKVQRNVRRLQARIVKATQEGRWGKVKALQHLLTHSFSAKALAVKRVTENQGKRTPGVDGVTWNTPAEKAAATQALRQAGYHPQPLRRMYIPKQNGRRALGIPVMHDRAMQALYLQALDPIAETTGDPSSYAYRRERSTADAIAQCFLLLSRKNSPQWIWEGDIRACFDRLSHAWLEAHIPMDKAILHKWLKAGFMERNVLYPTDAGTPQGAVCSPVLANMALDGLETALRAAYPLRSVQQGEARVYLVRYADDEITTGTSRELLEARVQPVIEDFIGVRGLELAREKTRITHIEDGFDFLGQNLRKYKGKLLIKPSRKNVKRFLARVREMIKASGQATAGQLIQRLNQAIRGWANYHRHVASKRTFAKVDHAIFQALWRWAKRRHPKKPQSWIKAKYFQTVSERHWVFSGAVIGPGGQHTVVRLLAASSIPIQRHVKVKAAANPYDLEWEQYYEERLGVKMAASLQGRRTLLYLWKEQNGACPVCQEKITKLTGWHSHHIVQRTQGGSDKTENRVLLHPNCHRQVHSQGIKVAKPRPPIKRGVWKA